MAAACVALPVVPCAARVRCEATLVAGCGVSRCPGCATVIPGCAIVFPVRVRCVRAMRFPRALLPASRGATQHECIEGVNAPHLRFGAELPGNHIGVMYVRENR